MIRSIRLGRSSMVWTISIAASCIAPGASAADDFITLDIGAYRFNANNDISVGGNTTRGTEFRSEREGTPEDDTILRLDGTVRLAPKHRIRLMYLNSTREGSAATDRDITFRDRTIPAGTSVNSGFTTRRIELDYMYSFWKTEATEVAFSAGLHSTKLEARLDAPSLSVFREASANGPLPMFGIAATHRIEKWELLGHIYGMKASIGDYDGSAFAYRLGGRYYFTPNIGVGVALAGIHYSLDVTKSSWLGSLDASTRGGEVFLTLRY